MPWEEEIPGGGSSVDPLDMLGRRRRLGQMTMPVDEEEESPTGTGVPKHRIADDMNTAGNRSGGPAGAYADPGRGRLKDMMDQEAKLEAPQPKPTMKHRLMTALTDAGPTALAAAMGSAGGTVGADERMKTGVQRRQQQADLEKTRNFEKQTKLKDQIEAEQRSVEQREYQHGEDQMRQQTAEKGMNLRQSIAEEAENARSRRLETTLKGQKDLETQKQGGREELEDSKQKGRMQLQMARRAAQESTARIHAAAAEGKIPPVVAKSVDTFQDSQSRMDVMQKAYDDAVKDPGNQQAMLNLLANHLGMTMGLQKGARLNQAIIDEAKRSGYLDERIEAHFGPDGYMTGVVLTPRQMTQMVGLAQDRLMEDARKVTSMEEYFGVKGKGGSAATTPRIPGGGTAARPGTAGGAGGGAGAASPDALKPPSEATPGMKWQHRIVNGKVEWRMVKDSGSSNQ